MFTRTFSVLLAAGIALASCTPAIDVGRAAPQKLAVRDARVTVAGPPGYCIDERASRLIGDGGAFVLLGSCASIAGNARAPKPDTPGVLTVTVAGALTGDAVIARTLDDLAAFFLTEAGRAALSRDGNPASVEVLDVRLSGETLYLRARDAAPKEGMSQDYWRALFGVNDRLLTVSVAGFETRPMSAEAGRATAEALAARIRAESAAFAGDAG
ncbi:MAG: hypothetical protein AAGK37_12730 [Pseudomonadota bacterium]